MATQPNTVAVAAAASNVAAAPAAGAPAQGAAAASAPTVLAAAETPLTTNVTVPPSTTTAAGGAAASGGASTTASATGSTPPTKPFPEAMLSALLQAKRNLDQLARTARQNAHTAQYNSIVALSTVSDEATFLTKFAAIEQTDKAFRTQQSKEQETAEALERSGVRIIETHRDAAAAVERSLRGQALQQPQSNQERILRVWEKKARGEKKTTGGKKSRAANKSKAGEAGGKGKASKKATAKRPRKGGKGP